MKVTEAFAHTIRELRINNARPRTIRNYITAQNSFLKAVPDIPIQIVTLEHVSQWKDHMLRTMQPSSMARYISCLRAVLDQMDNLGYDVLESARIKRVKVTRKKPTYLDIDEVRAIQNATDNVRDRAIFACLFSMGCRVGDLLNLNRDDVEGKDEITIDMEKTGGQVVLFIEPYARKCLDEYLETRKDTLKPLFVSGQRRRITVSRVEQILHEIADKAGVTKNVTPHVYRHTFATDLRINGADLKAVQDALGHSSINSTQLYVHVPDAHRREIRRQYHSSL